MMERYPEWSDKYSVQILVAIGGGSWKDHFHLNEGHNAMGFFAELKYPQNGHVYKVYEGNGNSKREALHKASFNLIKSEEIQPQIIKEKVLDILELANGFGAGIDSKQITDNKENNLFVSVYDNHPTYKKGAPASDKKSARKNLVYELLQPLWDNLENKKRKNSGPRVNLAATFPPNDRGRNRNQNDSSDGSSSTRIHSDHSSGNGSSGTLGMIQKQLGQVKISHPDHPSNDRSAVGDSAYHSDSNPTKHYVLNHIPSKPTPTQSDILDHQRVPKYPSATFDHKSTDLSLPTDQSDLVNLNNNHDSNILRSKQPQCTMCTLERSHLQLFSKAFESCRHDSISACHNCIEGHKKMMSERKSRTPNQCPLCYYLSYVLKSLDESVRQPYKELLPKPLDPFAANGVQKLRGATEISAQSSRLYMSEGLSSLPLSASASNTAYTPYFRGNQKAQEIHNERHNIHPIQNPIQKPNTRMDIQPHYTLDDLHKK